MDICLGIIKAVTAKDMLSINWFFFLLSINFTSTSWKWWWNWTRSVHYCDGVSFVAHSIRIQWHSLCLCLFLCLRVRVMRFRSVICRLYGCRWHHSIVGCRRRSGRSHHCYGFNSLIKRCAITLLTNRWTRAGVDLSTTIIIIIIIIHYTVLRCAWCAPLYNDIFIA